jgi:predicted nucleic-acid-binding protein
MTPFSRPRRRIERQLTEENPGLISLVRMVETVWVLDRVYGLSNHEVAKAVERILQADTRRQAIEAISASLAYVSFAERHHARPCMLVSR